MALAAAAPIIAAGVTGAAALGAQAWQSSAIAASNKQSRKFAREVRSWEEEMANTAVQRHAADLEAAGFNRILASGGGQAATPTAPMAQALPEMGNSDVAGAMSEGLSSALNYRQKEQELVNMKVAEDNMTWDTNLKNSEFQLREAQLRELYDTRDDRLGKIKEDAENARRQGELLEQAKAQGASAVQASQIDAELMQKYPWLRAIDMFSRSVQGAGSAAGSVPGPWRK